ncbi:MAG: ATP-binding protein [Acidobacteria bacterium]|nr:MAG: ATP-binding protein [Acidobacteriota bacterium]PYQ65928.1 MAG: ATP-binding protein [Acidobacteriota bacterium]
MTKTPPSHDAGPIRMSLSSRFENIELAQHLCGKLLDGREVSEETKHWLLMALREALANAIKHGNRQDVSKRIHVEMDVVGGNLQISIRDEGEGFDPATVEDPLAPENRLKTSGRGIFYMKTFMDDVRFRRLEGGGMEIVLTKNLGSGKEKEGNRT